MRLQYEKLISNIVGRQAEKAEDIEYLGRKNLSSWLEFRKLEAEGHGFVTQPDIDALICKKVNGQRYTPLHAVEFKAFYFRRDETRLNWSYYAGLDQALALLNFGVDYVTLLQCFVFDVQDSYINPDRFGLQEGNYIDLTEPIRHLIKSLNLPIGYTAAFTFSEKGMMPQGTKVEILDLKSKPDSFVIRAKRNKIGEWNKGIRKIILKKLNIADEESMIMGPLLM